MQDRSKSFVAALLIAVFLIYAVIQLTCNSIAPVPREDDGQSEGR